MKLKHPFYSLIITMVLSLLFSCHQQPTVKPFGWRATNAEADSLTGRLEYMLCRFAPTDSIKPYVDRLFHVAGNDRVNKARAYYWQARYFARNGALDSAKTSFDKSLELVDSANFYYDWLRFKTALHNETGRDRAEQYRLLDEAIRYAQSIDDKYLEASSFSGKGVIMSNIGEAERSLYYNHKADSIYKILHEPNASAAVAVNTAKVETELLRHKEKGISTLRWVLEQPLTDENPAVRELVLRNLFIDTQDISYLRQAYEIVKNDSLARASRGYSLALMSAYYYERGDTDEFIRLAYLARHDLEQMKIFEQIILAAQVYSIACEEQGKLDSALYYRDIATNYTDSLYAKNNEIGVKQQNTKDLIKNVEVQYKSQLYLRNLIIMLIIAVILIGVLIAVYFIKRRMMRASLESMKSQLSLEKARNKIATSKVSLEEKDRILTSVRDELAMMLSNGTVDMRHVNSLNSEIRTHLSDSENDESFLEMFDVVNPRFLQRLDEYCPTLSEQQKKLSCYILLGYDVKKTSRMLSVHPKSVYQAHWRLRKKLNVKDDRALRDLFRSLNN